MIGWTGLARVVRGRFLSLREEDFVQAARFAGASEGRIIVRHMTPSFLSHIIASLTLAVPSMILSETRSQLFGPGNASAGAQLGRSAAGSAKPAGGCVGAWLLAPGLLVVISVLAFNFVGDGLRDAADPYAR